MPPLDACALLARLHGGKSMSTGQAMAVAEEVVRQPELFPQLFEGLAHPVALVRMRAAYALAKVVQARPALLQPFKEAFLDCLVAPDNSHLARACMLQALHQLALDPQDISLLVDTLFDFMHSDSSIVKTFSLQLLTEFAEADPGLRPRVLPLLWQARDNGTPAMRARARKLMKRYGI